MKTNTTRRRNGLVWETAPKPNLTGTSAEAIARMSLMARNESKVCLKGHWEPTTEEILASRRSHLRRDILAALMAQSELTRTNLGEITGGSVHMISRVLRELVEQNMVRSKKSRVTGDRADYFSLRSGAE